jgi:hypothetical protein
MYHDGLVDRVAATRRAVEEGPAGGWTISRRVFGETEDRAEEFAYFVETACYLRRLRVTGVVVRDVAADGTFLHRVAESTNHPVG